MPSGAPTRLLLAAACVLGALAHPHPAAAADDPFADDRARFVAVWDAVVDGEWPLTSAAERALADYPLWIDLVAARHSAAVARDELADARAFLDSAPALPPVGRLRYRYVIALARTGDWAQFFAVFDAHYSDTRDGALGCTALDAAVRGKSRWSDAQIAALAKRLWLVPRSQDRRCDAPFAKLKRDGTIDRDWHAQRVELAIDARAFGLARYLAASIDRAARTRVDRWQQVYGNPRAVLASAATRRALTPAQHATAIRRLALSDPASAADALDAALDVLPADEHAATQRYLGLAGAQDGLTEAAAWLDAVPAESRDERVLAWRTRAAVRAGSWEDVLRAIGRMPLEQASKDRWRYWEGVALLRSGQREAGLGLLEALAGERSFHGFAAADLLALPYVFDHRPLKANPVRAQHWASDAALARVRELYLVGQVARARHELAGLTRGLEDSDLIAIGRDLHALGWHHEAIGLVSRAGHLDDLSIRFPLAHEPLIRTAAGQHRLAASWVLGLARSESLFDPTVRSGAGALGVMQLLPATARQTARSLGVTWRSAASLFEPDVNIRLGTAHLAQLQARFNHPALATAAYNAGAHRVQRWLPAQDHDAIEWIELIPYDETRDYVERVMFAAIVFEWRSGAPVERLSRRLPPIGAYPESVAAAPRL